MARCPHIPRSCPVPSKIWCEIICRITRQFLGGRLLRAKNESAPANTIAPTDKPSSGGSELPDVVVSPHSYSRRSRLGGTVGHGRPQPSRRSPIDPRWHPGRLVSRGLQSSDSSPWHGCPDTYPDSSASGRSETRPCHPVLSQCYGGGAIRPAHGQGSCSRGPSSSAIRRPSVSGYTPDRRFHRLSAPATRPQSFLVEHPFNHPPHLSLPGPTASADSRCRPADHRNRRLTRRMAVVMWAALLRVRS